MKRLGLEPIGHGDGSESDVRFAQMEGRIYERRHIAAKLREWGQRRDAIRSPAGHYACGWTDAAITFADEIDPDVEE